MGRSKRKGSEDIFDKIIDQGLSLLLSFIFSTALIGGGGYMFFELPKDLLAIESQTMAVDTRIQELNAFNEMLAIFMNGWFSEPNQKTREQEVLGIITANLASSKIDSNSKNLAIDWLTDSMSQLATEKGKISGFKVEGEPEMNLQENILAEYDLKMIVFTELSEMMFRWERETPEERDNRLGKITQLTTESLANLSSMTSQLQQMKSSLEIVKQQETHWFNELKTQINIVYLKMSLSGAGVIIGLAIIVTLTQRLLQKQKYKR